MRRLLWAIKCAWSLYWENKPFNNKLGMTIPDSVTHMSVNIIGGGNGGGGYVKQEHICTEKLQNYPGCWGGSGGSSKIKECYSCHGHGDYHFEHCKRSDI